MVFKVTNVYIQCLMASQELLNINKRKPLVTHPRCLGCMKVKFNMLICMDLGETYLSKETTTILLSASLNLIRISKIQHF